jgi:hypothetical protein
MPFQRAFDGGAQYSVISWPRRAGKDISSFAAMVSKAITVPGSYYYLFPTRAWATRALWDNICEWAGGTRLIDLICPPSIARKNNSEYYLDLINGSRIKIDGTDSLNFVGQGGSGYVLSEFSLHKPEVTGFLAPILTEGNAWVVFNGTLRGRSNHLYQILDANKGRDSWFTEWLTLEDTKTNYWINEGEGISINADLRGKMNPYDGKRYKNIQDDVDAGLISLVMAKQEYMNLAEAQVAGSYYGREMAVAHEEGRIGAVDMTNDPVFTFWDLGVSDDTTIVFAQLSNDKFRIIDYYHASGRKIEDYAKVIHSRSYKYGGHYGPHDLSARKLFGDLISAAKDVGIDFRRVPKTNNVLEDIETVRRRMKDVYIDERCKDLIADLESYHEREASGKPCHQNNCAACGGASHGADAFRTMIMADKHNLVDAYLGGGRRNNLPKYVDDSAEDYCEDTVGENDLSLREKFRGDLSLLS